MPKIAITASKVPELKRMLILPRLFGSRCVHFETAVFNMAKRLSKDYNGAFWEFYTLSNGGFYMVPDVDKAKVSVSVHGNMYDGEMTPEAFGIVCCLMVYSNESFSATGSYQESLAELFHMLRDYASTHPEADEIFSAID